MLFDIHIFIPNVCYFLASVSVNKPIQFYNIIIFYNIMTDYGQVFKKTWRKRYLFTLLSKT